MYPVAPALNSGECLAIATNIWGRMMFQCGNTNQITDSSINCIFNAGMSCVLKTKGWFTIWHKALRCVSVLNCENDALVLMPSDARIRSDSIFA